jgi:hypothetical protein
MTKQQALSSDTNVQVKNAKRNTEKNQKQEKKVLLVFENHRVSGVTSMDEKFE